VKCARPYIPIPPLQACSMLTCWTVCHRSLCGRIFESKNISCSVVESAGCASDRRRGRGGACEAAARGCRRSVPAACSARRCLARKSPEHALCCCTCVSSRVPLGGFHNYIVIISNARDLRPDNSRSTLEFPEIAPSDLSARRTPVVRSATVMVTAHRFGSWIERVQSHRMVWGQLIKAQTRPSRPQTHAS
jgi:hypothetical protein